MEAAGSEESDRAKVNRMLQSLRKEKGTLRVVTRGLQVRRVAYAEVLLDRHCEPTLPFTICLGSTSHLCCCFGQQSSTTAATSRQSEFSGN